MNYGVLIYILGLTDDFHNRFTEIFNESRNLLFDLPKWYAFAISITLTFTLTYVFGKILVSLTQNVFSQFGSETHREMFKYISYPIYVSVFSSGIYASLLLLGLSFQKEQLLQQAFFSLLLITWALAFYRVGTTLTEVKSANKYLDEAFIPIFTNLWRVATVILSFFGLLSIWGIDITPLLASAGVLGISIGFAAKDTISNFFGGVALYFDNTYQKGDYIILESGEEGTVIDIGIRSTVLLTREGIRVTVPNSMLNRSLVTNESAPQSHRRISISVGVAYGEDIDEIREILLEIAEDSDTIREQPPTRVHFSELGTHALELELRCWIDRPNQHPKAVDELNTKIYKRFNEEGIEIPFPQRDIRFRQKQDITQ